MFDSSGQNDWDEHLKTVVYCINTTKQASTKHTPYFVSWKNNTTSKDEKYEVFT